MYTDFEDYGWSSGTYCQKVYQGYTTKIEKDVVISTWQSIYTRCQESILINLGV